MSPFQVKASRMQNWSCRFTKSNEGGIRSPLQGSQFCRRTLPAKAESSKSSVALSTIPNISYLILRCAQDFASGLPLRSRPLYGSTLRSTFVLLFLRRVGISVCLVWRLTLSPLCTHFQSPIQFFDKCVQLFRICFFRGQLAKLPPTSFFFTVGHDFTKARAVPYLGQVFHLQATK